MTRLSPFDLRSMANSLTEAAFLYEHLTDDDQAVTKADAEIATTLDVLRAELEDADGENPGDIYKDADGLSIVLPGGDRWHLDEATALGLIAGLASMICWNPANTEDEA